MSDNKKQSLVPLLLALFFAGLAQPLLGDDSVGVVVLPSPQPQPAAQSSGLMLDMLGIPTGNGATRTPEPGISSNRFGPHMNVGFGQVVFDQTDLSIKGRDEVTNLVIARRHLSRRDQTKTLILNNKTISAGTLIVGVHYRWVTVSGSPDFSNVGAGVAPYRVGDTFIATGTTPTQWGTASLVEAALKKHSIFGPAWTFNYSHTIIRYGEDVLMESYGRRDFFEKVGDNVWEGRYGRFGRLTYDQNSRKYTLRMPHGTLLEFAANHVSIRKSAHLTKIKSPNTENTLTFTYETTMSIPYLQRKLTKITDSFGHETTFTYNTAGYVTKIQDFSGRSVEYTYDTDGRLLSARSPTVTSPGGVNNFTSGKTYNYKYYTKPTNVATLNPTLKYALTEVIYPNQVADGSNTPPPRYKWTYEDIVPQGGNNPNLGFVKKYTCGGGTFFYSYRTNASAASLSGDDFLNKPLTTVTVVDRMGTETTYKINYLGQILSEAVKTRGLRSSVPSEYVKSFKYNADGQLKEAIDEIGSKTEYIYGRRRDIPAINDANLFPNIGNPRNVEYPLTSIVQVLNPQKYIIRQFVYEPVYNKLFKSVGPRGFERGTVDEFLGVGDTSQFTTTMYYDYMEDLETNKSALAALLGINSTTLTDLLPKDNNGNNLTPIGDVNGDGANINQIAGNLVKIEHPDVTLPDAILPAGVTTDTLGAKATASETYRYNGFGQLIRHQDAELNVTSYAYLNVDGNESFDGGGYLNTIVRDAEAIAGRNNSSGTAIPALALKTTYQYSEQAVGGTPFPANSRGIPTAEIDARGVKTVFYINELDQRAKTVRAAAVDVGASPEAGLTALKYESEIRYDHNNNVTENRINENVSNTWISNRITYDVMDQATEVVKSTTANAEQSKTTYTYGLNQNRIKIARGDAATEYVEETRTFDERDLLSSYTLASGEPEAATFEQIVGPAGKVIISVDAEDADADDAADGVVGGDPTRFTYDGFNRVTKITDRSGNYTKYTYDSVGNVINEKLFTSDNVLFSEKQTVYDERNRLVQVTQMDSPNSQTTNKYFFYDGIDRVTARIDTENNITRNFYDGLSRMIETVDPEGNTYKYEYNAGGDLTKQTVTNKLPDDSNSSPPVISTYAYDALGRKISKAVPNQNNHELTYDSRNNLLRIKDGNNNEKLYTYDWLNRLVKKEVKGSSGSGVVSNIEYEYDQLNRVIEERKGNFVVTHVYDDRNNRIATTSGSKTQSWEYDGEGDVTKYTAPDGTITTRTYDAERCLLTESYNSQLRQKWTWSSNGKPAQVIDYNDPSLSDDDVTYTYTYGSDRIEEKQQIGNQANLGVTTEWTGKLKTKTIYPNGREVTRSYDVNRKVEEIKEGSASIALFTYENVGTNAAVDPERTNETRITSAEKIAKITYGNGTVLKRQFDPNLRATGTTVRKGANNTDPIIVNYNNTYDLVTVLHNAFLEYNKPVRLRLSRRKSEQRLHFNTNNFDTYTFDSDYRMTEFRQDGTELGAGGIVSTRVFNNEGLVTEFTDKGTSRNLQLQGTQYIQVDNKLQAHSANGNVSDKNTNDSTDSEDLEYIYDYKNRLTEVYKGNDKRVAKYIYDARGRRVAKLIYDSAGTTVTRGTRYLYDVWQVVEERDWISGNVQRQYVDGPSNNPIDVDEHIQMRVYTGDGTSHSNYYYHTNDQGFIGALTDSNGAVVEYYKYDWLGKYKVVDVNQTPKNASNPSESTVGNPYAFQGRRFDSESRLYYYRNRYYDPDVGRFLNNIDPLDYWNWLGSRVTERSAFRGDPINIADSFGKLYTMDKLEYLAGVYLDFSTELNGALFWTGDANNEMKAAQAWTGGKTLEQTKGGKQLDRMALFDTSNSGLAGNDAVDIWDIASKRIAQGASGSVFVITPNQYQTDGSDYKRIYNMFGDEKTFTRTERPQLIRSGGPVTHIKNKVAINGAVDLNYETIQYDRANNIDWLRGK